MPVERVGEDAAEEDAERAPPDATKPKMPIAFARSAGSVKSVIISERATADTTPRRRPGWRERR
jgi:hypothetical protein